MIPTMKLLAARAEYIGWGLVGVMAELALGAVERTAALLDGHDPR